MHPAGPSQTRTEHMDGRGLFKARLEPRIWDKYSIFPMFVMPTSVLLEWEGTMTHRPTLALLPVL